MNTDKHRWFFSPGWHGLACVAMLMLLALGGCGREGEKPAPQPPRSQVEQGPVRLTVEFDPAAPTLADRPTLTVTVDHAPGVTIEKPEFGAEFGDFRVIDSLEELPRVDAQRDREIVDWVYKLEPIRAGRAVIWPVDVAYVENQPGGDARRHLISSKPLKVEVSTTVETDKPSLVQLRPESPLIALPYSPLAWIAWGTMIVVVAGGVVYLIYRRRHRQKVIAARPLTPAEIAYRELQRIVDDALADRDVEQFHVAVTGVVRRFIERTTSIRAPEQTTEEFLHEISVRRPFPDEENRRLKCFLEAADLVKFAAHRPREEDVDASLDRAREFVDARSRAMAAAQAMLENGPLQEPRTKETPAC